MIHTSLLNGEDGPHSVGMAEWLGIYIRTYVSCFMTITLVRTDLHCSVEHSGDHTLASVLSVGQVFLVFYNIG